MSAPGRAAKRAERREGRTADAEDADAEEEEAADEEGVARVRRSSRAAPDLAMEARADGLAAAVRVSVSAAWPVAIRLRHWQPVARWW